MGPGATSSTFCSSSATWLILAALASLRSAISPCSCWMVASRATVLATTSLYFCSSLRAVDWHEGEGLRCISGNMAMVQGSHAVPRSLSLLTGKGLSLQRIGVVQLLVQNLRVERVGRWRGGRALGRDQPGTPPWPTLLSEATSSHLPQASPFSPQPHLEQGVLLALELGHSCSSPDAVLGGRPRLPAVPNLAHDVCEIVELLLEVRLCLVVQRGHVT